LGTLVELDVTDFSTVDYEPFLQQFAEKLAQNREQEK
jgi:hypothetical protein